MGKPFFKSKINEEFNELIKKSNKQNKFEIMNLKYHLGETSEKMIFIGILFCVFALNCLLHKDFIGGILFVIFEYIFMVIGIKSDFKLKRRIIDKYKDNN